MTCLCNVRVMSVVMFQGLGDARGCMVSPQAWRGRSVTNSGRRVLLTHAIPDHPPTAPPRHLPRRLHTRNLCVYRPPWSTTPIPSRARTRPARSRRRRRAGGRRVSCAPPWQCAQADGDADGTPDTAFRQQRLKAWQYVGSGQRAAAQKTMLTAQQAHPHTQDGAPAVLHRRRHIRAHRRAAAVCERAGKEPTRGTSSGAGLTVSPRSRRSPSTTPTATPRRPRPVCSTMPPNPPN